LNLCNKGAALCKKLLLLFCVLACLSAVRAQEYKITEAELERLENISTALEARSLSLLQQVQLLTVSLKRQENKAQILELKLQRAQEASKNLNELLQAERATSQSLSASLNESEKGAARIQAELNDEKLKRQKAVNQRNMFLFAAILQALVIGGFAILKIFIWSKRLL
jgi:hypothetical protein